MADLSEAVKAKMLARLSADAAVIAIVPAVRIYPMQPQANPPYPFIRYGVPTVTPYEDGCGDGVTMTATIHAFTRSENEAQDLARVVSASLDDMPEFSACDWLRTNFMIDGNEADVWHVAMDFAVIHTA